MIDIDLGNGKKAKNANVERDNNIVKGKLGVLTLCTSVRT